MQCRAHGDVIATRGCTSCDAAWCDDCARTIGLRQACPACGHLLGRVDAPELSLDVVLMDAARRVFSVDGMITASAFALVFALARLSWILELIYLSAVASYYFVIVRHVGDGKSGMPGPTDTVEDWHSTIGFAFRGLVCMLVGFAPVIAYLVWGSTRDDLTILGFLMIGQMYMPAAILAVAVSNSTLAAVWPIGWLRIMARAPDRYARFALVWLGSVVAGFGLLMLTTMLLPPTVIGAFGSAIAWSLYWFGQAVLVGHFLQQNRSRFGWD